MRRCERIKCCLQVPIVRTGFVEKKPRQPQALHPRVSAKYYSIARSDASEPKPSAPSTGITIQIRLKSAAPTRLVTRKNTEFWLSANE